MESGEHGYNVGLDNYVLWKRHNAGGCTHSWGLYMIPHSFACIGIPLYPLLALLFLRWELHLITVQAHFTVLFLGSTDPY